MPGDPTDIHVWRRLDARLTTSGQPSEEQLAALQALGVTHVVNLGLHTHEKALPDEAGSVRALGMAYVHIPVAFDNPTDADFAQFRATMQALEGRTVHVHCIANLRVSAFMYRYRREILPEPEARAEMEHLWRPGGVWARFIGDEEGQSLPHRYAKRDY
jgi:protein tyrosine phosphatase (PTP) superfamily phosphohydrolase (DUF442 family)